MLACALAAVALAGALFHLAEGAAAEAHERHLRAVASHRGASRPARALKGRFPYYHTSDEIREEAQRLAGACGGRMSLRTVHDPNVSIDVVRMRAKDASPSNRVFLMFGEHSRELIGPESGLYFLQMLCGEAPGEPSASADAVEAALKNSEFEVVLNGNPRSRLRVEDGEFCVRTNPDGVDLNRNWDERWEPTSATYANANPGPAPFSEPETRIFRQLVTDYKPTTFLTVHSGTRGLYMPWAYDTSASVASRNKQDMMEVLRDLDSGYCECPYGAAGKEVGYSCPGTCLDWVYDKLKTPYSFAFEIYTSPENDKSLRTRWDKVKNGGFALMQRGETLAHSHFAELFTGQHASDFVLTGSSGNKAREDPSSCFRLFNPDTKERYDSTVKNWASAYLDLSERIVAHMRRNATA